MVSRSRRDSVGGGGGSTTIFLFRGLQKPAQFSGGEGSTRNFPFRLSSVSATGPSYLRSGSTVVSSDALLCIGDRHCDVQLR